MGKWENGEMGKWGNGEMGKRGNGEIENWKIGKLDASCFLKLGFFFLEWSLNPQTFTLNSQLSTLNSQLSTLNFLDRAPGIVTQKSPSWTFKQQLNAEMGDDGR